MICIKSISNPFILFHITSHSWHSFIHIIQKNHGCWTTKKIGTAYTEWHNEEQKKLFAFIIPHGSFIGAAPSNGCEKYVCADEMGNGRMKRMGRKFTFFISTSNRTFVSSARAMEKKYAYQISQCSTCKTISTGHVAKNNNNNDKKDE